MNDDGPTNIRSQTPTRFGDVKAKHSGSPARMSVLATAPLLPGPALGGGRHDGHHILTVDIHIHHHPIWQSHMQSHSTRHSVY